VIAPAVDTLVGDGGRTPQRGVGARPECAAARRYRSDLPARRADEIGLGMAVGANTSIIMWMIARQGSR